MSNNTLQQLKDIQDLLKQGVITSDEAKLLKTQVMAECVKAIKESSAATTPAKPAVPKEMVEKDDSASKSSVATAPEAPAVPKAKNIAITLGVICAAMLAIGVVFVLMQTCSQPAIDNNDLVENTETETVSLNQSDSQYLANNVWNEQDFDGLTAPEWQRFFKMLKVGDATGLLENPAYSNSGNPAWDAVMNALKNHPDKEMAIAIAIKEASKSGSLNVPTLKDEVTAIVNDTPGPSQQKASPAPAPQQPNAAPAGPKAGSKGSGSKATSKEQSKTGNPINKNSSSGSGNNNTSASQGRASGSGNAGNTNSSTQNPPKNKSLNGHPDE